MCSQGSGTTFSLPIFSSAPVRQSSAGLIQCNFNSPQLSSQQTCLCRLSAPAVQRGISLIEVLVTLVLVSISLLGMMTVQAKSLQLNNRAYVHSQAVSLAYDMAERIRINKTAAIAGKYEFTRSKSDDSSVGTGTIAEQDKAQWLLQLANVLPDGAGQVVKDTNDLVTITLFWTEDRKNPGGKTFALRVQL
ncbi:type IV pilus modification protein PilV [Amphritea sp. HPY]|uniref:type IV pilus modification protein PilV n=1 Tax=Amphritea sp. HPY TaxID=3421652 RepID=UPI003D7E87C8